MKWRIEEPGHIQWIGKVETRSQVFWLSVQQVQTIRWWYWLLKLCLRVGERVFPQMQLALYGSC